MRLTETCVIWICDACGNTDSRTDGWPRGWRRLVVGRFDEHLGDKPVKDLCFECAADLSSLLGNTLGDHGDMAQAWDEGYANCAVNAVDDPQRGLNPYRPAAKVGR